MSVEGKRLEAPNRHCILLNLQEADVDIVEFDQCIASGKRLDLERAMALYTAPLFEGSSEEWTGQDRGAREQDCLRALQTLGEQSLLDGDNATAIRWFRRAIALDPWWDAAHRLLMDSLAKEGDVNEALLVYRAFDSLLREEAGTGPDEQTTALYLRLRSQARDPRPKTSAQVVSERPATVAGYIPSPLTELIGREDERIEVAGLLRRSRLVTLTGVGGIGKTRLAIAIATEASSEFVDGCWFVSLDALSDGGKVVQQIGGVLSLSERSGQSWLQLVTDHLRHKRTLLVLDNCEHLLNACSTLCAHLLQECSGLRVLITSREVLGITGESVWAVPTLAVPEPKHLPQGLASRQRVLASYEGVHLFLERARAASKSFVLSETNMDAVAEICYGLEGVPLALELAAAHVRTRSASQILSRLGDHLGLLADSKRNAGSRHHTLRSTLDWSYELLNLEERILLRRLSVFVGGWTLESVEFVCSSDEINDCGTTTLLALLVEKSLVLFMDASPERGERYRMLETVRQYATEKLVESAEEEAIKSRHRAWCLDVAERAGIGLGGKEQVVWLRLLSTEYGNLLKALAGFEEDPAGGIDGLRLASLLTRFWDIRGGHAEGRERLRRALEHQGAQAITRQRATALNNAGNMAYNERDSAGAKQFFQESLDMWRRLDDLSTAATTINNLANTYADVGDHRQAIRYFEECLEISQDANQREAYALALSNLAYVLLTHLGEAKQAQSRYEEALSTYSELDHKFGQAICLDGKGSTACALGEYELARSCHEEAMRIKEELQNGRLGWSVHNLGVVAYSRGDLIRAREYFSQSKIMFAEVQDSAGASAATKFFGFVELAQGDLAAAEAHLEEALRRYRQVGDGRNIAIVLAGLGDIAIDSGRLQNARSCISEALDVAHAKSAYKASVVCHDSFASLVTEEGNASQGVRLWAALHTVRTRTGEKRSVPVASRFSRGQDKARAMLGEPSFGTSWAAGLELSLEQASAEALAACSSG